MALDFTIKLGEALKKKGKDKKGGGMPFGKKESAPPVKKNPMKGMMDDEEEVGDIAEDMGEEEMEMDAMDTLESALTSIEEALDSDDMDAAKDALNEAKDALEQCKAEK